MTVYVFPIFFHVNQMISLTDNKCNFYLDK